jgi:predicted adenine nucleotide alpha hydrolase (AANH) superfamily ATPase
VIWSRDGYGLNRYLRAIGGNTEPATRCPVCYEMRLEETAKKAAELGMSAFSTTLLYSKYQRHELIRNMGEDIARKYGLEFFYEDFREGWKQGIEEAVSIGIYRQPYCGCVFSEAERYSKRMARLMQKMETQEERP